MLEKLGVLTSGTIKKSKPFYAWKASPVKEWEVTIQMLSIGELAEIARLSSSPKHLEVPYISKVFLLAKCIININGAPVVTDEDLEYYNEDHNLTGNQRISLFEYKVLHIKKWTEAVVNRLAFMYDEIQDEYLVTHLGSIIDPDIRRAIMAGLDLSIAQGPIDDEESTKDMEDNTNNDTEEGINETGELPTDS